MAGLQDIEDSKQHVSYNRLGKKIKFAVKNGNVTMKEIAGWKGLFVLTALLKPWLHLAK